MDIKQKIEELLSENATDLAISKALRQTIDTYFKSLNELFNKTQGKDFLVRHTRYIDSIITAIYKVAVRKMFKIYTPLSNTIPITVVALGSYGREQLAPYSDIDLMIVYEEVEGYNIKALIEKILYIIWDAKMKLGHRVHEIGELEEVAKTDDTIKTALLESRFIVGSRYLWFKVENKLNKIRNTNQKEYILHKIQEAKKRREKYPILMQPNIKEGVGGLRDSNFLYWIANVLFGVRSLKDLQGKVYTEEEYKEYRMALEWLFRVRVALHLVAKKKEDRLLLQYIPEIAKMLDIKGKDEAKKQQNLVSKTLNAMHIINNFSIIFAKKLTRPFLFEPTHYPILKKSKVAPKIFLCQDTLYASYFAKPSSLKEMLEVLVTHNFSNSDPSFIRYAKHTPSLKSLKKGEFKMIKKLFYKNSLSPAITLLYNSNLLPVVIPPLKKVLHMPQFDGYHTYPVDIHSIKALEALENIKDPFLKELFETLSSSEKAILRLAVLLHDSGKGRKQRHHEVGAKLFKIYAKKLGFEEELIELGALLIKHHTDMTNTAYNKDIYSEKVVFSFLAPLKTKKVLDLLYLLTYADLNGVGKDVYSSYNAKLLRDLYNFSLEALDRKKILDEVSKRLKRESALVKQEKFKELPRTLQKKILSIESNLFFIKNKIEDIIEISKIAYETQDYHFWIKNEGYLAIEIIKRVPINLGYLLGKLSYLDIASMEVFKLFDETKYFKIEFMEPDEENIELIKEIINQSFDMSKQIELKKPIIEKKGIKIECDHSKSYAIMELEAENQKGLLAYIAKVFDQFGIDIATARIHTVRNRAKDLFLIEKNGRFCSKQEEIVNTLTGG